MNNIKEAREYMKPNIFKVLFIGIRVTIISIFLLLPVSLVWLLNEDSWIETYNGMFKEWIQ